MSNRFEIYEQDGYVYSPIIKQYDTSFFKTITGTPAMSGNLLRFTSASAASFIQHLNADLQELVTIPTVPTAGDNRIVGFKLPDSNALGATYFQITGAVFQAVSIDKYAQTKTTAIAWDAAWTATPITLRINWDWEQIIFYVNGVIVAMHSTSSTFEVPQLSLPIYILNGNADNMDFTYISINRAASII